MHFTHVRQEKRLQMRHSQNATERCKNEVAIKESNVWMENQCKERVGAKGFSFAQEGRPQREQLFQARLIKSN